MEQQSYQTEKIEGVDFFSSALLESSNHHDFTLKDNPELSSQMKEMLFELKNRLEKLRLLLENKES